MFEQAGANSLADPVLVGRELPEQQAGDGVGRLAGSDRSRQDRWHDGGWREAVIADHPMGFMDDEDGCKALLLVGQRSRLEPAIERRLAAGELGKSMGRRQQFGAGDSQTLAPGF